MQRVNPEITEGFGKPSITARPSLRQKRCDSLLWLVGFLERSAEESVREDRRFDIRNSSRALVSVALINLKADQPRYHDTKESRGIDKRLRDSRSLCRPSRKINI